MNKPKISVIVPIYNVEKFLHKCIDSIINQTLKDIEIILVNDGSPDNCPKICDEYAKKDNRIRVIHKQNGGYGTSCNVGIKEATGEYIGIVEADDWIEPDMYEKLYNQITNFDAEVCIASFYDYKENSTYENGLHDIQIEENIKNTFITSCFNILEKPNLLITHPSVWCKLYESKFIKEIKFDETPKTSYQDGPFITEVYCKAKKMIGLHDYVYHYRRDNETASSSDLQKSKQLINVLYQWNNAKNILKKYNMYESLKEEFYAIASRSGLRFYRNISSKHKKDFFKKWEIFFEELKQDETFTYRCCNNRQKEFIQHIINGDFRATLFDEYKSTKILGIPIIEKTKRNIRRKTKLLKFPLYCEVYFSHCTVKKYLMGIFKIINSFENVKYYLFGIQFAKRNKELQKNVTQEQYFENTQIQTLAIKKHQYLEQFKNIHNGKDIVILACGPTSQYMHYDKNKIYIGINRAFEHKEILLDYLFIQDQFKEGMQKANEYKGRNCKKFYGVLSNWHCKKFKHCNRIPINSIDNIGAYQYYLESIVGHNWAYDISSEPFGEFRSTVFSALQFALYTTPKSIYIVGCDCTNSGYFYNKEECGFYYTELVKEWKNAQNYISTIYPEIEIFVVNPIGLKGLFRDVYTKEYIESITTTTIDKKKFTYLENNNEEIIYE